MFSLGTIVNNIEAKRRQDIRLANHNTLTKPVSDRPTAIKPKMVDKSTMTEVTTRSIQSDTTELENMVKEMAVLEKFKKAQAERLQKAALMTAVLGASNTETYDAEDE